MMIEKIIVIYDGDCVTEHRPAGAENIVSEEFRSGSSHMKEGTTVSAFVARLQADLTSTNRDIDKIVQGEE